MTATQMPPPANRSTPTRTADTISSYERRVTFLRKACARALNVAWADYRQVAVWLLDRKSDLRGATFRQYRAALIAVCERIDDEDAAEAIALLNGRATRDDAPEAEVATDMVSVRRKRQLPRRTSSGKDKRLRWDDFRTLVESLKSVATKGYGDKANFSGLLITWLHVGMLTGLRPQEHAYAKVLEDDPSVAPHRYVLWTKNCKNTNGRATGPDRRIVLDGLPVKDIEMIRAHFRALQQLIQVYQSHRGVTWLGAYNIVYTKVRMTLNRRARALWPRRTHHPTLYSARHQFVADAKASGFTRIEIAAMAGHASAETASLHYARKVVAENLCLVRPFEGDLPKVREGDDFHWRTGGASASSPDSSVDSHQ